MTTRTARTAWNGTLQEGRGQVELTSSGAGTFDVSWPRRTAEDSDGVTSPEELIGAALSSCYAMQFSALIGKAGGTPHALHIAADVDFGPDGEGGFHVSGVRLTVRGEVDGMDADTFVATAEEAKRTCPVSKALAGVDIALDAALTTA